MHKESTVDGHVLDLQQNDGHVQDLQQNDGHVLDFRKQHMSTKL